MRRSWIAVSILLFGLLIGCQREEALPPSSLPAPTILGQPIRVDNVSMLTLLRNPESFDGEYINISGEYRPLPLLVCKADTHRSPATWELVTEDTKILASGLDRTLRNLAEPGLQLTVEGRWTQWEGPVGCGRRAPRAQIWYLDVTNIISPNPLIVEKESDLTIAQLPAETLPTSELGSGVILSETVTIETETSNTVPTPTLEQTTPTALPQSAITPTPFALPTATSSAAVGITPTPTSEATNNLDGTETLTPGPGTPSATPTDDNGTPSATPSPRNIENIQFEDIVQRGIDAGNIQRWDFIGEAESFVTISVIPLENLDVVVELVDPRGVSVDIADEGGPGESETLNQIELNSNGNYRTRISSVDNTSGTYILSLTSSDSEAFRVFQEFISFGDRVSEDLPELTDHLWIFEGETGNEITIEASANEAKDLLIYLHILDNISSELEFINEGDENESLTLVLPDTGFYVIGVGESGLESLDYTLSIEVMD